MIPYQALKVLQRYTITNTHLGDQHIQGLTNGIQEGVLTIQSVFKWRVSSVSVKSSQRSKGVAHMIYTNPRARQQSFEAGWNIECPISFESWKDITWIYLGAEQVKRNP